MRISRRYRSGSGTHLEYSRALIPHDPCATVLRPSSRGRGTQRRVCLPFRYSTRSRGLRKRPVRLVWSRTPPFHGGNRGSNPLRDAKPFKTRNSIPQRDARSEMKRAAAKAPTQENSELGLVKWVVLSWPPGLFGLGRARTRPVAHRSTS